MKNRDIKTMEYPYTFTHFLLEAILRRPWIGMREPSMLKQETSHRGS